jgi:hypothetical protein
LFCRSLSDSEGGDKIKGHPTRRQVIWSQCSDPLLGRDEVTRTNPNINLLLILAGFATLIDICQVKYLNNIIEQDHRFIKKITKPISAAGYNTKAAILLDVKAEISDQEFIIKLDKS